MRKELDDELCFNFPLLFIDRNASMRVTNMCWGFPGDGWYNLIREAAEKLEPLIKAYAIEFPNKPVPRASQVKEKFGTLRFYLSHGTDEMRKIIEDAEIKSANTCEDCGEYGKLRKGSWLLTLCDKCHKKSRS